EGLSKIISADARADGLVARNLGDFFAEQPVPGFFVECECGTLNFRCAERQTGDALTAALILCRLEHLPPGTLSSSRRIDIHAAQLHRAVRRGLQAEHTDHLVVLDGYPKATGVLAVVRRDATDLFCEGALDIGFKYVAELRWAQTPIDGDE